MNEYEFTLKFKLPNAAEDAAGYLPALEDAGCDDALIGVGQTGHIVLEFIREADTAKDAFLSAINDVHSAIKGAILLEASPDYVGVSDVADLLSITRQAVAKIMKEHFSSYPSPAHSGKSSIWYLSEIAEFFEHYTKRRFEKSVYEVAAVNRVVNTYSQVLTIKCTNQVRDGDECDTETYPKDIQTYLNESHLYSNADNTHTH